MSDPLVVETQDSAPGDLIAFGPCCCCQQVVPLTAVAMLSFKAPTPGTGWGCYQCGLPMDGAIALVCDRCADSNAEIRFVCGDLPSKPDRVSIAQLQAGHDHDLSKHPELQEKLSELQEEAKCRLCGCTEECACIDPFNGEPCHWVAPDLCSACSPLGAAL